MKTSITATLSLLAVTICYSNHHLTTAQLTNNTTTTTSPSSPIYDYTQQINLSTTMTINWSDHIPLHTRYCGPRTVGGYTIAQKYCSPQTACGLTGPTAGVFGGNGNDCKGRNYFDVESGVGSTSWMCFSDVRCMPPSDVPSTTPSVMPSASARPSGELTVGPSAVPTGSLRPSVNDKTGGPSSFPSIAPSIPPSVSPTKSPSTSPTSTPTTPPNTLLPTGSPVEISTIKLRGYFCGTSYENAVEECTASKSCNSHADCDEEEGEEKCFPNVSCEFVQSEAGELGDHVDVVVVVKDVVDVDENVDGSADENADGDAVLNFSNDGASSSSSSSSSSFGFVCNVKSALVSLGLSVSLMLLMCTVV